MQLCPIHIHNGGCHEPKKNKKCAHLVQDSIPTSKSNFPIEINLQNYSISFPIAEQNCKLKHMHKFSRILVGVKSMTKTPETFV